VFGGAHPFTAHNERTLRNLREVLRARETPSPAAAAAQSGSDAQVTKPQKLMPRNIRSEL
jgi:hypothetical protein